MPEALLSARAISVRFGGLVAVDCADLEVRASRLRGIEVPPELVPLAIDEFPAFSFLLGDLHPHVLALPFDILAAALALVAISVLVFHARRDRPHLLVGWLWFVGGAVLAADQVTKVMIAGRLPPSAYEPAVNAQVYAALADAAAQTLAAGWMSLIFDAAGDVQGGTLIGDDDGSTINKARIVSGTVRAHASNFSQADASPVQ